MIVSNKKRIFLFLSRIFGISAALVFLYLIIFPIFPEMKYRLAKPDGEPSSLSSSLESENQEPAISEGVLPPGDFAVSSDRLIIPKIGVNAPIVVSDNEEYGLSQGAWLVPDTSTPDKGGNTVITGHRFKYLPPNNVTFYLFHKLEKGDSVFVVWKEKKYTYKIIETKIVEAAEVSIEYPTKDPRLTLYTCHPIYSQKQRLVVAAEPAVQ
jgi:sortase A